MGVESQVSTLCHEISHFYRVESKESTSGTDHDNSESRGPWGGAGTDDLPTGGDYKHEKGISGENIYIEYRKKLKTQHSLDVFRNAYNFEQYFQLTEKECEIEN